MSESVMYIPKSAVHPEESGLYRHEFLSAERIPVQAELYIAPQPAPDTLQERVRPWMLECFGAEIANDRLERGDRFLEESLELLQSGEYPKERANALIEYVYGRPKGEPAQEVGGVMITLAAYCLAHEMCMHEAGEVELARISKPSIVEKIRQKQAAKPTGSALPIPQIPQPDTQALVDAAVAAALAKAAITKYLEGEAE